MNNFEKLGLSKKLVEVLGEMGFENPTEIQQEAIPLLLTKDPINFIGLAQTGTGKTAAFGLPLLDLIDQDSDATQAIIMSPTRELGQQTAKQLVDFCRNNRRINVEVVYGGANIVGQIKALKRPTQIVVATPGRLIDLLKRKALKLDQVRYVILDEADEMLNMGFKEEIDTILEYTPEERVTWLFSATMPSEIRKIIKKYMENPLEVSVNSEVKSNVDISHQYIVTKTSNKIPALRRFLDIQPGMRGILFCRTKRETQEIADDLGNMGYGVEALHGDLTQSQRDSVMKRFKTRSMQLLIATDVAARGIDVNDLTHVIHHTLPDQLENYTHRSGRTGRAGKKGISMAFINSRENRRINELEKRLKIKFELVEVPAIDQLKSSRLSHWANLIINTKVDENADKLMEAVSSYFADLSKEDILKRLITTQLDHLMIQGNEDNDLNETRGGSDRGDRGSRSDRGDRSSGRGRGGFNRYFINVGTIDGVTKADLLHFLADISDVDRNSFGDLSIQKNCTFFDLNVDADNGFAAKFNGIDLEGRKVRVNLDDEGPRRSGGKPKSNDGGGYGTPRRDRPRQGGPKQSEPRRNRGRRRY